MKKIKNICSKISAPKVLCFFLVIQPLIDVLPFYEQSKYQILGFTIPTIVRCLFIGIFALLLLKKLSKRSIKYIIIYASLVLIYTIIHHIIVSNPNMVLANNYTYSLIQELFYIVQMLFPLIIIIFTYYNDITYDEFINTILLSSIIIAAVIITGNILCISYQSYGIGHTSINWFHWFFVDLNNYTFEELTSKGWFYMANQVSSIMVLLFPFNIYDLIMRKSKISFLSTSVMLLSMIMIGTRTASYGWLLIIILIILMYLILKYKFKLPELKDKKIYSSLIITLIGICFLFVAPITNREFDYQTGEVDKLPPRPEISEKTNMQEVYDYIEEAYPLFHIHKTYIIDVYNYKYDPEFWYDTFDLVSEKGIIDGRKNQLLITNRIMEHNNYKLRYTLFGYSFSRMRNAELYPEHDFIAQTFTMGVFGLFLFISPYVIILILSTYVIIKHFKESINLLDAIFLMTLSLIIAVSIITSHVFDDLFVTIYIGFICGYFINKIDKEKLWKR